MHPTSQTDRSDFFLLGAVLILAPFLQTLLFNLVFLITSQQTIVAALAALYYLIVYVGFPVWLENYRQPGLLAWKVPVSLKDFFFGLLIASPLLLLFPFSIKISLSVVITMILKAIHVLGFVYLMAIISRKARRGFAGTDVEGNVLANQLGIVIIGLSAVGALIGGLHRIFLQMVMLPVLLMADRYIQPRKPINSGAWIYPLLLVGFLQISILDIIFNFSQFGASLLQFTFSGSLALITSIALHEQRNIGIPLGIGTIFSVVGIVTAFF